jgi:16S rRNA (guanine527-N7)-methyltransferase
LTESEVEAEPIEAAKIFGSRIGLAREFAADLVSRSDELGLLGPLEKQRLWTRHLINCGLVAPLLNVGTIGDIGSGAGLPGLVLAIARPDVSFLLIEPMERRVEWLHDESEKLALENVTVLRARAEDVRLERPLDQVTARAVSALRTLIPLTVPLLRRGGEMLFMKGARVDDEIRAASRAITRAHLSNVEVLSLGEGFTTEVTRVFRATVD